MTIFEANHDIVVLYSSASSDSSECLYGGRHKKYKTPKNDRYQFFFQSNISLGV